MIFVIITTTLIIIIITKIKIFASFNYFISFSIFDVTNICVTIKSFIIIRMSISTITKMTTYLLQLQMGFNSIPLSTLVPNIGLLTLAPILLQVLLLIPPLLNIVLFLVVDILLVFSELVSASLFTFTGRCWQVASCSSTERLCFCKNC